MLGRILGIDALNLEKKFSFDQSNHPPYRLLKIGDPILGSSPIYFYLNGILAKLNFEKNVQIGNNYSNRKHTYGRNFRE